MGKYFLQTHSPSGDPRWPTLIGISFDTLPEAKSYLATCSFPKDYRIAEAYTVTRYKPVKL